MPGLTPPAIRLSSSEQAELEKLVNQYSTPQQIAKRGCIILLADEGKNNRQIARELDVSRDMVRLDVSRLQIAKRKCGSVYKINLGPDDHYTLVLNKSVNCMP